MTQHERASLASRLADHAVRDVRRAVRRLVARPAFSLPAVLTLALGLGAALTVWTVVESVVARPLPYPEPEELVFLDHAAPGLDAEKGLGYTPGIFWLQRRESRALEEMGAWASETVTLDAAGAGPERVVAGQVTPSIADVLRVPPALGAFFGDSEEERRTVVLAHDLWNRRFGADPGVVGETLELDGATHVVVGVMPEGFRLAGEEMDVWVPLRIDESSDFGGFWLQAVGRMAEGVTPLEVVAEASVILDRLAERYPKRRGMIENLHQAVKIAPLATPLRDHVLGGIGEILWTLLGAVGLVLLVATLNVANLFVVHAEAGRRDRAVHAALGAGRGEILLRAASEGAVVVGTACVLGWALAAAAVRLLVLRGPADVPRLHEVAIRPGTLAMGLGVSVLLVLVLTFVAAGRGAPDPARELASGQRGSTHGRGRARGRRLLIAVQMALAMVLTVGCALLLRTFDELRRLDPGFEVGRHVATFHVALDEESHPSRAQAVSFYESLLERIEALPGVETAGVVTCLPLEGWCTGDPLQVKGRPKESDEMPPVVALRRAGPGYFDAVGLSVVDGRNLEAADHRSGRPVLVLSETAARRYFPGEDAVGGLVRLPTRGEPIPWHTVVGVVEDAPARRLENPGDPVAYFPLSGDAMNRVSSHSLRVVVRGEEVAGLGGVFRHLAAEIDPRAPVSGVKTTEDLVGEALSRLRFTMVLLLATAGLALFLGAVGLYGVISHLVGSRRTEIGVRMALGARSADVRRMVLREGMLVALAGLGAGLLLALVSTRLLRSLLYGVGETDPPAFAVAAGVLLLVALLATWLPATRAATVDPAESLRPEA